MSVTCTMEFAVEGCPHKAKKALDGKDGIQSVSIESGSNSLVVLSNLSSTQVNSIIETSGQRGVLMGYGGLTGKPNLGAAVALMDVGLDSRLKGVVRFVQVDDSTCVVDGTLDGLLPGKYGVYLHEFGDISAGCNSCGDILGKSLNKPVGEIGEITSTAGRAEFRVTNNNFKVWDIIGRSCVLHDQTQSTDNRHCQQTIGKIRQKDFVKYGISLVDLVCHMIRHCQQTISKIRQKDFVKYGISLVDLVCHMIRHCQQTIDLVCYMTMMTRHSQQTIGKIEQKDFCKVWDIIGRSCVLHDQTQSTDNRLLCGIVARSAGLFQNTKRICACDGVPVWDERDKPVAGPSRKSKI
ncbi:CCS [Mytilus coruscus]|uniref:CCS n=1 Tax=Mytilus coruscus TaxID=42192 RepID=A0A6J8BV86_MYTCO|nr:CCS [Mytilus coruscus]